MLYALLQTSYVQTALVKYITGQIEEQTGVRIQVGGVDFRPMRLLVLNDVLLEDFKQDTLFYCRDMRVKTDSFSFVHKSFHIDEICLDEACFHLWISRAEENASTNVEIFLDSLQRSREDPAGDTAKVEQGKGWTVGLDRIRIRRSHFTYREEEYEPEEYGVNWTDVDCRDLEVEVSDIDFSGSPFRARVSGLSFTEKSGLKMVELSGKIEAGADHLEVTDATIELERSKVDLVKLVFDWTPDRHDWRYFTSRIQQYYELGPSAVSFIDLAYFNGILRGIDNTVRCSGVVSNTINRLEGHDLYFELGEQSVFQGSFRSEGLPDVWNTLFHIELRKAHLSPQDLSKVYLPWFGYYIPVPAPLYRLPYVDFEKIRFDGTLSDFIAEARSISPDLSGQLNFSYSPCKDSLPDCVAMEGEFRFDRLNAGKLTGLRMLGNGVCSGSYAGIWKEDGPAFHVKAALHRLNIQQGQIRDADVALTWENEKTDLMASVENEKVKLGMVLTCDVQENMDFISARGKLALTDLAAFGWDLKGGTEGVATDFEFIKAGRGDRGFTTVALHELEYRNDEGAFTIETLSVEDNQNGERNTTTLHSDVLDLSIEGNYKEVRPLPFVLRLMQNYLPAYSTKKSRKKLRYEHPEKFDFHYAVQVKNLDPVLKVIYPDLRISPGASIVSVFRQGDEKLNLFLSADTLHYRDISLIGSEVNLTGDLQKLQVKYTAERLLYGETYRLYNVRDELVLSDNHVDNKLSWCNWGDRTYSGELGACIIFAPDEKKDTYTTRILIHPGVVVMDDSVWHVSPSAVRIDGKEVQIDHFAIRRGNEYLSVDGRISEDPQEKLWVRLGNFSIPTLTRIALNNRLNLFGMATGTLTLQDYYEDFLLISDFNIKDWGVHQDTLGSLHFRSFWDADNRSLVIGAENRVGEEIPLQVNGFYAPSSDSLQVEVRLQKVGLGRLGVYASEYITDTEGHLSGHVKVGGKLKKPDISGWVCLDSVQMKVNAINVDFGIDDSIRIADNRLLFDDFCLKDRQGHRAVLQGEYRIWEDRYNLTARLDKFMVLNTTYGHNESFYGQVYLSGLARLTNPGGMTRININASTENESRLYLPLISGVTEQSNNFLHFVNTGQPETRKLQTAYTSENIDLSANLELNEHLNVQVIFDPTVGDILKASGKGDIKFAFDKDGKLSMFGEYRIARGDYLFTLSNLVNKKFVLTPGGTITWTGSPYDALLDINAVYNLKTGISELLPVEKIGTDESGNGKDDKVSDSGRKVPVECILNLSDQLTNPVVKFDINFPTLETQSKSYIQSLFSSQDEINKQMFSLLLLNRFYQSDNTADYGNQAQTAGVTTLTEMLSNQLSRWFSQFSHNVDIGFAYRRGDRDNEMTSDELELAVSTQLLNDRITISANGNVDVGGSRTAAGEEDKKTNIAGDFDIEVKLNPQGTLKMKAYSHTDEKLLYNNTETIQGVGVSYQESFDTFRELLHKYFGFLRRKRAEER